MDKIEAVLSDAERLVYNEDKRINQLLRTATKDDEKAAEQALMELRKLFYEKKHALEAMNKEPAEKRNYSQMGRWSNICRNVVALFNDLGLGLQERSRPAPQRVQVVADSHIGEGVDVRVNKDRATRAQFQKWTPLPRHYSGLGDKS